MQALADSHKFVNNLTTKEMLRTAYMWRFNKDITDEALRTDSEAFDNRGKVPPYLTEYMLHVYGTH